MTDTPEDMTVRGQVLIKWLRNPWSKMDAVERGPIPEWVHSLMLEAADVIEAQAAAFGQGETK